MKNWRNHLSFLKKILQKNRTDTVLVLVSETPFMHIVEGIISSGGGVKSQTALVKSATDKRFQQRNKKNLCRL